MNAPQQPLIIHIDSSLLHQNIIVDDKIKQIPLKRHRTFDKLKKPSKITTTGGEGKPRRNYVHWTFDETMYLALSFIDLNGLEFSAVQARFAHRDVHACRVKWANDSQRFTQRGANYNWRTFLVAIVLDFLWIAYNRNHPMTAKMYESFKAKTVNLLNGSDPGCFIASSTYRLLLREEFVKHIKGCIDLSAKTDDKVSGELVKIHNGQLNVFHQGTEEYAKLLERVQRGSRKKGSYIVFDTYASPHNSSNSVDSP